MNSHASGKEFRNMLTSRSLWPEVGNLLFYVVISWTRHADEMQIDLHPVGGMQWLLSLISCCFIKDPSKSTICCLYFLANIFYHKITQPISYRVWCLGTTHSHFVGNIGVIVANSCAVLSQDLNKSSFNAIGNEKLGNWKQNKKLNLLQCQHLFPYLVHLTAHENSHKYGIKPTRSSSKSMYANIEVP